VTEDGYAIVTEGAEGQEALSGSPHVVVILPAHVWDVVVGATVLEAGWNSSGEAVEEEEKEEEEQEEEKEEEEEEAVVLPPTPRLPLRDGLGVGSYVSFAIGRYGGDLMKPSKEGHILKYYRDNRTKSDIEERKGRRD
jgi:hypothetical protein